MAQVRDDSGKFVELGIALHAAVASISGNQLPAAVVRGALDWIASFNNITSLKGAGGFKTAQHEKALRAIRAGEVDAAAKATGTHLACADLCTLCCRPIPLDFQTCVMR
jgi:DNA-binding FadR family transcriptional regulator